MKSTGMVRALDSLGRVVIPKDLRRQLNMLDNEDSFEIFVEGDSIVLKKYQPGCVFCGEVKDVVRFGEQNVCSFCVRKIGSVKGV